MTISKSKIEEARNISLVEYCESKGFDLKPEGDGNYRIVGYSGLIIKDNYFYQFGSEKKGNSIDFCVEILEMKFKDAANELLSFGNETKNGLGKPIANAMCAGLERKNIINICELPSMSADNHKVIDYLTKNRGLPEELISQLISSKLLYQDSRNNCVFPCYDKCGEFKGTILRGTLPSRPFKGRSKGSDVDYGWLLAPETESSKVIIVEAPIDALSIIALYDAAVRDKYILALGGLHLRAIETFLEFHPGVDTIIMAVDNDDPASEFISDVKNKLGGIYHIKEKRPKSNKDWNEVLLLKHNNIFLSRPA